ncbi:MAG: hypothetical protein CML05_04480 [Pseudozobellia sp.]|nr:hypothetical protein [Pseudozobellia sp.]|tara:strand:+ start:69 stop:422 length:354 start_codon:yes stop_codon:yes gene_type:complete
MAIDYSKSLELLQKTVHEALYDELVAQLQKDFVLANINVDLMVGIDSSDLCKVLHEKVYYLIMERFSEYLNLLYVIDVPERDFKKINVTDVVDVAEQVTHLILEREHQKVWLKSHYS